MSAIRSPHNQIADACLIEPAQIKLAPSAPPLGPLVERQGSTAGVSMNRTDFSGGRSTLGRKSAGLAYSRPTRSVSRELAMVELSKPEMTRP